MPRSSSGLGRLVLSQKIRGSTPLRGTTSQLDIQFSHPLDKLRAAAASIHCSFASTVAFLICSGVHFVLCIDRFPALKIMK